MKSTLLLLIASVLCLSHPIHADEVKGMINFKNVPVAQILPIYKSLSGLELVVDSRAKRVSSPVTVAATSPLSKAEAERLIEKALLDQAAIVITRLDDKRASVTYNDALTTTR
jgi:type II secretory pathway component GspD/PulD (secretin)